MYSTDRPLSSVLISKLLPKILGEVLPKILDQLGPWLCLSLKSQIPKLIRNDSGFPIIIYIKIDGTPIFNDGTLIIIKVESQGPPNIQLGVKP